jgi:hypothetical protein
MLADSIIIRKNKDDLSATTLYTSASYGDAFIGVLFVPQNRQSADILLTYVGI